MCSPRHSLCVCMCSFMVSRTWTLTSYFSVEPVYCGVLCQIYTKLKTNKNVTRCRDSGSAQTSSSVYNSTLHSNVERYVGWGCILKMLWVATSVSQVGQRAYGILTKTHVRLQIQQYREGNCQYTFVQHAFVTACLCTPGMELRVQYLYVM